MHALHFTFGLGAFLGSFLSRPFVFNEKDASYDQTNVFLSQGKWTIRTLYPLVGLYGLLSATGFIFYFITNHNHDYDPLMKEDKDPIAGNNSKVPTKKNISIVTLMSVIFFLYVGIEVTFGTFIALSSVKSSLAVSRAEGSDVTAVFWGTFAATRGLAILLAIVAQPGLIMWGSYSVCIIGAAVLSTMAHYSSTALYIGTSLMGVGMASIFATGFLWTERRISISSKVSAAFIISSSLGAKVFPVMIGQFIEEFPMMLHYLSVAIVSGCALIFAVANIVGRK